MGETAMPKLPVLQTLRRAKSAACQTLAAQPAPVRWLVWGVLLMVAILAGGAITAYGGLLLVLLLWALCTGTLWLLLGAAWKAAFPGESCKQDHRFRRCLLVGAVVGVAVIAGLVFYRRTVYGEDAINYYAKQNLLFNSFATSGFYGVSNLAENLLTADYKMFMNLFVSLPYLLLPRTINMFMVSYALTCFVPMWTALLMVARKLLCVLAPDLSGGRRKAYYGLCMGVMVLWPMFLWPATHGMPDAFGLTFAAIILLLCADYRFDKLEWSRLAALFAATFALILTRRWYMFWVVAFYLCYTVAVLAGAARRGAFRRVLFNLLRFGLPSVAVILVVLLPTFRTILTTDYADIYGAYYGGGFLENCLGQLRTQGLLWLLVCLAGLVVLLRRGTTRIAAAVTVLTSLLAMILFTRTQSLGDHQSLILAPAYLLCLFAAAAAVCSVRRVSVMRGGTAVLAAFFAVNACNALRLSGKNVSTVLLSGENLDLTRRTDLDAMAAVTDFVLENCSEEETVYINIDTDGYSGSTFAYSDPAHPQLQSMILWENSVPSTHGFPTGIWSSRYVMVTDKLDEGGLVGAVNVALRTQTPSSTHYTYVTEFSLQNGVVLYCYERTSPPDAAEADYYKQVFVEYDARWPELFSQRIDEYMAGVDQGQN